MPNSNLEVEVFLIGKIENDEIGFMITLDSIYKEGLKGLADYSYIQVLWWFERCDNPKDRGTMIEQKPYKNGPEEIGVFALHSPKRPNSFAVSNVNMA